MAAGCLWALPILAIIAQACTSGEKPGSVCAIPRSSVTVYTSETEDTEPVEDVNDADLTMHMQTRVYVDLPPVHDGKLPQHKDVPVDQQPSLPAQILKSAPSQQESIAPKGAVVPTGWEASEVVTLMQTWATSMPFMQIATILSIIIVLLGFRKLAHVAERAAMRSRKAKAEVHFDASAQLQKLLKALRFEPSDSPLSTEMHSVTEDDTGNHTEEEPESEVEAPPEEPEAEAAVDNAVVAIAKRAKQLIVDVPQKQPEEATATKEVASPIKATNKIAPPITATKAVGLKIQVISC